MRLAFGLTTNGLFFVEMEVSTETLSGTKSVSSLTTYANEDIFLRLVVSAELEIVDTGRLVAAVLLGVSRSGESCPEWIEVELTPAQLAQLGLGSNKPRQYELLPSPLVNMEAPEVFNPFGVSGLYELLMHAPTPFLMLVGPEHRLSFVNVAYLRMHRRSSADSLLGKPIRAALPYLKGQQFLGLLDRVYETGEAYVGHEILAHVLRGDDEQSVPEERYFDFIYQPIRSSAGNVEGIMVQATDVTTSVLARQASDSREHQLYRQWAELEAIYRSSPIGLACFHAKDFRVLRLNRRQAELMGGSVEELLGKRLLDWVLGVPGLKELLERVAQGETIENYALEGVLQSSPAIQRSWVVSYTPLLATDGSVEAILSLSLETTSTRQTDAELVGQYQGA